MSGVDRLMLMTLSSTRQVYQYQYAISTYALQRLGRNPEDYEDVKGQPHVQVALRMKTKGQSAKAGDVVPYIFCLGEDGTSSKTAQADRAYHPEEIRRSAGKLKIGLCYILMSYAFRLITL